MLMVPYTSGVRLSNTNHLYDYSVLGESFIKSDLRIDSYNVSNIENGNSLYHLFNLKYEKAYPVVDPILGYSGISPKSRLDCFYKRRVLYISEDAKRVVCGSIIDGGIADPEIYNYYGNNEGFERHIWKGLIEVFDGTENIYSEEGDEPHFYYGGTLFGSETALQKASLRKYSFSMDW